MTERNRARIELDFSDGTRFDQWERATVTERFDDSLGTYSFKVKPVRDQVATFQRLLQKGELVTIYVNDNQYASPVIESVTTSVNRGGGVTFDVECKSILLAATEASADPTIYEKQKADVPISTLIERVLEPFDLGEITTDAAGHVMTLTGKGIEGRAPAITVSELKTKDAQVQDNEAAYSYCARMFSRLGVALRVNYRGELLLTAPDYEQQASYGIFEWTGSGNRATSISLRETNRGQYSRVVIRGKGKEGRGKKQTAKPRAALRQGLLTGRLAADGLEEIAQARYDELSAGAPFDNVPETEFSADQPLYTSSVHPFKPRYYVDKRSRDNERCGSFCKLVHTKNAAAAFEVTAAVDGLVSDTGATWAVDTICRVESTTLQLNMDMWVHEVSMTQTRSGATTTLKMIPKGALVLGDIPG